MTIVRTRGNTAKVGISGQDRHLENVIAGTNVSIDYSDPLNPVISSTGGGASYTFTNGLTESGGTVKLGGSLTENTTINADDNSFTLENASSITISSQGVGGNTYGQLAMLPDGVTNRYFNTAVANNETYEANLDATADGVTIKWSGDIGATGAYTTAKYGWGLDTETGIYGFHIYSNGTTYGGTPADSDLRFRIRSSGEVTLNLGSDATGDIYRRNSSGYLSRLALGSALQVLRVNSGGTDIEWAAPSGGGLTIGSTSITGGTSGRLLTSGATVGEQTLGTGVSTWLSTPSWTNFQSAITGTSPYLPLTGATYTTTTGAGLALTTSTLSSGNLVNLTSTSTAAASNTNTILNISSSGANATSTQTVTGAKISVTNTGTSATNDALTVSSSGGTTNNAIKVSGGNIVLSQSANQSILKSGGILTVGVSDFNTLSIAVQNTNRITINGSSGAFTFTTNAVSSGAITPYSFNDFARTNQTASTETNFVNWTPNTTQYATGAQTILRTYRMNPAVYSFVGASTITDAYTLWVDDPVASTNATITNNWAAGFQGNVQIAGLLALGASASGSSSFRIPHGTAPSSPVDGDIWTTTAGLYVRINGSTVGPLT